MKKLFVWDFHGVLEKGTENAVVEVTNSVLESVGYSARLTEEESNELYGRKWFEYFEHLLPEESHEIHLELQAACFAYQFAHPEIVSEHTKPNRHAREVLSAIREEGHEQLLISNTDSESIDTFLESAAVKEFFPEEYTVAVHAHDPGCPTTKADVLRGFLEGKSYDEIIIIGDSSSDMTLAEVCGGVTYLYTHPGKQFRECNADHKIDDLREILKEV